MKNINIINYHTLSDQSAEREVGRLKRRVFLGEISNALVSDLVTAREINLLDCMVIIEEAGEPVVIQQLFLYQEPP